MSDLGLAEPMLLSIFNAPITSTGIMELTCTSSCESGGCIIQKDMHPAALQPRGACHVRPGISWVYVTFYIQCFQSTI